MHRLRILGGASLLVDGRPSDSAGSQRKLMALLAMLAVARGLGTSRERIASCLWPESDQERSRGALKQLVHVLRRQLGSTDAVVGGAEIRLNPLLIESDLELFLGALDEGDHHEAVRHYGGPFLDGFHLPGSAEFEEWASAQRSTLAARYAGALEALAREAAGRGAAAEAVVLWRRLHEHDRFSAPSVVGLMEALDAAGDRASALRLGREYEALMMDEFGAPPNTIVTTLAEQLLSADAAAPAASPRPATRTVRLEPRAETEPAGPGQADPGPGRRRSRLPQAAIAVTTIGMVLAAVWLVADADRDGPSSPATPASIAVLPFTRDEEDQAVSYIADGLADELIGRLGRVEGLQVAARMSTFGLRGRGLDARAIADTLDVATVLDGSFSRDGDRLTVSARLSDPRSQRVLWQETYELDLQDVFDAQDQIVRAVVTALQLPPPAHRRATESTRPTADPEAYDLYLRGRYAWHLPLRDRLEQGTTYFLRAVERDPGFALAHAALAEAYVNQAVYGLIPARQALSRARIAAERALELDPNSVDALVSRGYLSLSELRFEPAEADLRRALQLNPSSAWAHHFLSLLLIMVGQPESATVHNRQALRLDPLSLPAHATAGVLLAQSGALEGAAEQLAAAWVLNPEFTLTAYFLGAVLAAQGAHLAARQRLAVARRQSPDYPGVSGAIMLTEQRLGQLAAAESVLVSLRRRDQDPRVRTNLAFALAMGGYNDEAFRMLHGAQWDVPALIGLRADPLLAGLRTDPRYPDLLQTIMAQH